MIGLLYTLIGVIQASTPPLEGHLRTKELSQSASLLPPSSSYRSGTYTDRDQYHCRAHWHSWHPDSHIFSSSLFNMRVELIHRKSFSTTKQVRMFRAVAGTVD